MRQLKAKYDLNGFRIGQPSEPTLGERIVNALAFGVLLLVAYGIVVLVALYPFLAFLRLWLER